jgi:hypothetical protein
LRFHKFAEPLKNKNTSLGPVSEKGHQKYFKTLTGVRAIPHGVEGVEGKKEAAAITMFLQMKGNS